MSADLLVIRNVFADYGRAPVLCDVDFSLARGQWLGLLGPNGSGKSTLLDCVVGAHVPSSGQVRIDGHCPVGAPALAKRRLGYAVAPERLPLRLTGRECLAVHARAKQRDAPDPHVLALAEALRVAALLDDSVDVYSYGTRQKLGILLALVGDPALVVLDESFNGLDPASQLLLRRELRTRVDAERCAVLLATHALDLIERCADRAALLHEGRIVQTWNRAALARARAGDGDGLEAQMAAACT